MSQQSREDTRPALLLPSEPSLADENSNAGGLESAPRRMRGLLCVLLLTALCLIPFAGKPVFIDDTLFLRVAEQIQKHPLDFFGFSMNWAHADRPMMHNIWNPPLAAYYAALATGLGGWSERTLHLAFMLPALAGVAGIFFLARRYSCRPALAAAVALATPVFLISSTTLMCDIMLVAFWVWALVLFERGFAELRDQKNTGSPTDSALGFARSHCLRVRWSFLGSGVLAGFGYLTKFNALALVPLLIAYGFIRCRRLGWWLLAPLLPLAFAAGYELLTWRLYGNGHFLLSSGYNHEAQVHAGLGDELTTGLVFAGGCCLPLIFFSPLLWSWRVLAVGFGLLVLSYLGLPHLPRFAPFLTAKGGMNWWLTLQAAVFAVNGLQILCLAASDCWEQRRPISWLLLLWTFGVFVYAVRVNYTINGRGLLLLAPVLGILVARRVERVRQRRHEKAQKDTKTGKGPVSPALSPCEGERENPSTPYDPGPMAALPCSSSGRLQWFLLLVPALIISLLLARADCNVAKADRTAATDLCAKYQKSEGTIWFEGHWGFQWYMEKLGAKALDMMHPQVGPDDLIVIPNSTPGAARPDLTAVELIDAAGYLPNQYCSTLDPSIGAGFYSDYRGPLPFGFGRLKPDYYLVFRPKR